MDELSITGARCVRPRRTQGFWRRQFDDAPTPAQRKFDMVFGIIMPILCFAFDPFVFRAGVMGGRGLYSKYQFYAYTLCALEMVALCAWLCSAGRAGRRPAALAGMLLAGALFSFFVGFSILPYSILGLFFVIGILGFVPFLTALVYLRNGWRAAGAVGRAGKGSPGLAAAALACGFFFALGAPAVAQMSVEREVSAALADVREGRKLSPARLRALRVTAAASGLAACDDLVWEYHSERDPARRARLAEAYAEITSGGDIEGRLTFLLD
ncbi:MAG: hypothetical protein ACJ74T_15280 [Pyrinomonadaceae bacterium]